MKEYNSTRDYLSGLTMDATYDLLPSPQYAETLLCLTILVSQH